MGPKILDDTRCKNYKRRINRTEVQQWIVFAEGEGGGSDLLREPACEVLPTDTAEFG